jgi:polysaccharide chain length determinant protein (PEP-CTERM system associated)
MAIYELDFYKVKGLLRNNKKLFMAVVFSVMTLAIAISYLAPKKYEAESTIAIEKNIMSNIVKGIAEPPAMDKTIKNLSYELTSRALVTKVINLVDFNLKTTNDAALERLIGEVRNNTDVEISNNNLLIITFRYPNPRIARDYVNALARNFIEENFSSKRDASYEVLNFLSEQADVFKQRLDKAEDAANQFKQEQNGLVNLDPGWLMQQINTSQKQLIENKTKIKLLKDQKTILARENNPLRKGLDALKKQLAALRIQFTDEYPGIKYLKAKIETLQSEIAAGNTSDDIIAQPAEIMKIDAGIDALKANQTELSEYMEKNRQMLNDLPVAKSNLQQLESQKLNEQNIYNLLSVRRNQSELSKQMELQDKTTTFRIVDPAIIPRFPVSPNRKKIIIFGIFASIGLAMGILILRDAFDDSVTMVATLKSTNIPVLAVIPLIKSADEIRSEKREDFFLYLIGVMYLLGIGFVLSLEFLGINYLDTLINGFSFSAGATKFLGKFMH